MSSRTKRPKGHVCLCVGRLSGSYFYEDGTLPRRHRDKQREAPVWCLSDLRPDERWRPSEHCLCLQSGPTKTINCAKGGVGSCWGSCWNNGVRGVGGGRVIMRTRLRLCRNDSLLLAELYIICTSDNTTHTHSQSTSNWSQKAEGGKSSLRWCEGSCCWARVRWCSDWTQDEDLEFYQWMRTTETRVCVWANRITFLLADKLRSKVQKLHVTNWSNILIGETHPVCCWTLPSPPLTCFIQSWTCSLISAPLKKEEQSDCQADLLWWFKFKEPRRLKTSWFVSVCRLSAETFTPHN